MKVLLRNLNGEHFVCTDVEYNYKGFHTKSGQKINEVDIVEIFRDTRSNYVLCDICGELVKNTPEAIEAHWKAKAKEKNCLTCDNCCEGYDKKQVKKTYKADEENPGKYISTVTTRMSLHCNYTYPRQEINTQEADRYCKYYRCRDAERHTVNDFFIKFPHPFEDLPTCDMLVQKKWKIEKIYGGYIYYHHPKMKTLKAAVSNKGIVDHFIVHDTSRSGVVRAVYSKKYDKLFFMKNGIYKTSNFDVPADRKESCLQKIKELF